MKTIHLITYLAQGDIDSMYAFESKADADAQWQWIVENTGCVDEDGNPDPEVLASDYFESDNGFSDEEDVYEAMLEMGGWAFQRGELSVVPPSPGTPPDPYYIAKIPEIFGYGLEAIETTPARAILRLKKEFYEWARRYDYPMSFKEACEYFGANWAPLAPGWAGGENQQSGGDSIPADKRSIR